VLLTKPQERILGLLKTYRCLRDDQICRLVGREFQGETAFIGRQLERLHSLFRHRLCQPGPGCTGVIRASPDEDLIRAVDVMLEFQKHGLETFRPGKPPFKLTFFKTSQDGFLRAYYVAVVRKGAEFFISQPAQAACKGRNNAVIFVLDSIQQTKHIQLSTEHYLAIKKDGGYQFYKGVAPSEK